MGGWGAVNYFQKSPYRIIIQRIGCLYLEKKAFITHTQDIELIFTILKKLSLFLLCVSE
jgi:hypothetical protein